MRKLAIATAFLGVALSLSSAVPAVHAADTSKVDCDAVMSALGSGKKPKEVASDMSISISSVYRCKRHAKHAAKAESKTSQGMSDKMSNAASAGAMASPSAAASPSATKP